VTDEALAIDGIDTMGGLRRLGGKRERYEALLRKFADKQATTVVVVRAALANGDLATAQRDLHSLKGAAASLGANALAEAVANAEHCLQAGHESDAGLRRLETALDGVVHAIRSKLSG